MLAIKTHLNTRAHAHTHENPDGWRWEVENEEGMKRGGKANE